MSLCKTVTEKMEADNDEIYHKLKCIMAELEGRYPHYSYVGEKLERIRSTLDHIEAQAKLVCVDTKEGSA